MRRRWCGDMTVAWHGAWRTVSIMSVASDDERNSMICNAISVPRTHAPRATLNHGGSWVFSFGAVHCADERGRLRVVAWSVAPGTAAGMRKGMRSTLVSQHSFGWLCAQKRSTPHVCRARMPVLNRSAAMAQVRTCSALGRKLS